MANFIYEKPFQIEKDLSKYRLLTKDYVSVIEAGGRKILKVDPKGLELLAKEAIYDLSFFSGLHILKSLPVYLTTLNQQTMIALLHITCLKTRLFLLKENSRGARTPEPPS